MKPFSFTLKSGLKIMILPDTVAHLNGHPVITATYSIYKYTVNTLKGITEKETTEHLEPNPDTDYLGLIRFDVPDRVFTYQSGRGLPLESGEIREIIQLLSEIREDQSSWQK